MRDWKGWFLSRPLASINTVARLQSDEALERNAHKGAASERTDNATGGARYAARGLLAQDCGRGGEQHGGRHEVGWCLVTLVETRVTGGPAHEIAKPSPQSQAKKAYVFTIQWSHLLRCLYGRRRAVKESFASAQGRS